MFALFSGVRKAIGSSTSNSCPVCGIQLNSSELETHFLAELDRLRKLSLGPDRQQIRASFNLETNLQNGNNMLQGPDNRWEVCTKIKFGNPFSCI